MTESNEATVSLVRRALTAALRLDWPEANVRYDEARGRGDHAFYITKDGIDYQLIVDSRVTRRLKERHGFYALMDALDHQRWVAVLTRRRCALLTMDGNAYALRPCPGGRARPR